jgi:hypothetical protein
MLEVNGIHVLTDASKLPTATSEREHARYVRSIVDQERSLVVINLYMMEFDVKLGVDWM